MKNKQVHCVKENVMIYGSKGGRKEPRGGEIILYDNKLEVRLEKDIVWLSQKQMEQLFNIERSVITKHIRNMLEIKELDENSVCAKFAHSQFR